MLYEIDKPLLFGHLQAIVTGALKNIYFFFHRQTEAVGECQSEHDSWSFSAVYHATVIHLPLCVYSVCAILLPIYDSRTYDAGSIIVCSIFVYNHFVQSRSYTPYNVIFSAVHVCAANVSSQYMFSRANLVESRW